MIVALGLMGVALALMWSQWHAGEQRHREHMKVLERIVERINTLNGQVDFLKWEISSLVNGDDWLTILEERDPWNQQ